MKNNNRLEQFSVEFQKSKTKVNHNSQSELRSTSSLAHDNSNKDRQTASKIWENASDQITNCVSFESDQLRQWCEFSGSFTERSYAKPKQSRITFETQLKAALMKSFLLWYCSNRQTLVCYELRISSNNFVYA